MRPQGVFGSFGQDSIKGMVLTENPQSDHSSGGFRGRK